MDPTFPATPVLGDALPLKYAKRKQFGRLAANRGLNENKKQKFSGQAVNKLVLRVKEEKLQKLQRTLNVGLGHRRMTIDAPPTIPKDQSYLVVEPYERNVINPREITPSAIDYLNQRRWLSPHPAPAAYSSLASDQCIRDTLKTSLVLR